MNNYSIENIKHLYEWLDENPNHKMYEDGYSVIVFDCYDTLDTGQEEGCGFKVREHIFGSKEEAWLFFEKDLQEHGKRDFWDYVDWNDNCVVSTHYDEGGWTHVWIEKWDGFDEDVRLSWEYDGTKYKSLKELWKEVPIFHGEFMTTDRPYIRAYDKKTDTHKIARLSLEYGTSFYTSCTAKEKELEAKKAEKERRRKELEERTRKDNTIELDLNSTDLPF